MALWIGRRRCPQVTFYSKQLGPQLREGFHVVGSIVDFRNNPHTPTNEQASPAHTIETSETLPPPNAREPATMALMAISNPATVSANQQLRIALS
jgi:hypothetical protein